MEFLPKASSQKMPCEAKNLPSVSTAAAEQSKMKPDVQATSTVMAPHVELSDFQFLKVLGRGAYGKVYQARKVKGIHKGELFAVKSVNKSRIKSSNTDMRHTKSERDVLVKTDHPFIVSLHFAFETSKRLYLVQEFCRGGELFRRMEVERMMLEEHAKFYLSEIVCALEYLHSLDIVYRDLKTENVMLDTDGHVKLIDFGLSKLGMTEGTLTNTFCGTGRGHFDNFFKMVSTFSPLAFGRYRIHN